MTATIRWLACGLAVALTLDAARGQSPDAAELLAAVARAPALEAARKRIDAARSRTESAGRLADPEIEAMATRVNGDAMSENRDQWELNVRQPLPKRGERAADRERTRALVSLSEAEYALIAGELAAEVAGALAEAEGARTRVQLLQSQLDRMDAVLKSIEARLAAGIATRIADRLTVQSRVAAMQLAIEQAQRTVTDAEASARGRLALPASVSLPAFAAPEVAEVIPTEAAMVAVANARVAEASAMGKVARASAHPATSVGLRFERERSSMGNEDMVGIAFSSEIPWRNRRYARAEVRATEADRAAAQADATAAQHRITTTLSRVERAERVAVTARRLAAETQARLDAEHDALSRATSAPQGGAMGGESAVLHAVAILDRATDTQLQIVDAETAVRSARAELWRHVPATRLLAAGHSEF